MMFDVDWCTHSFHSIPFHSIPFILSFISFIHFFHSFFHSLLSFMSFVRVFHSCLSFMSFIHSHSIPFHSIPFHSFSIQLSSVQFNSTQLNSISHSFITFSHSFQDTSFEFKCVHSLHSFDPNHFVSFLQSTPCIHSVQFSFTQFKHSFVFFQFLRVQHITLGHSSWT